MDRTTLEQAEEPEDLQQKAALKSLETKLDKMAEKIRLQGLVDLLNEFGPTSTVTRVKGVVLERLEKLGQ